MAAEYVRICSITVAGAPVVGFVLPGSDTCIKISGYITAQIEGGNLYTRSWDDLRHGACWHCRLQRHRAVAGPGGGVIGQQSIGSTTGRDSIGYATRYNLTLDTVSNTAYGPLVGHGEYQFNAGGGFDNLAGRIGRRPQRGLPDLGWPDGW